MYIVLLLIILAYHIVICILDSKDIERLKGIEITEQVKTKLYQYTILAGLIPALVIVLFVISSQITLNDIGLRSITLSNIAWLNIVTFILCGSFLAILIIQTIQLILPKNRQALIKNFNEKKMSRKHYDWVIYNLLLPETNNQRAWWFFVSLTAGICEEIVWRGAVIFLLAAIIPQVDFVIASVISCIFFGLLHYYQGIGGTIKTGLLAILFVLLYYVTNSIVPGMLLHFLVDFSSAFIAPIKDKNETSS